MPRTKIPKELDTFLAKLRDNLSKAKGKTIEPEWFNTNKGSKHSKLHSRVWGILAKTGFDLKYTVGIETGFIAGKSGSFSPDVQLWEKSKKSKLTFLIEYESTNSSDSRIIDRDLRYCFDALNAAHDQSKELPYFWLILYTLPDHRPTSWYHHDYQARKDRDAYSEMVENPHDFYKKAFKNPALLKGTKYPNRWKRDEVKPKDCHSVSECSKKARKANRKVFLVNLTQTGLKIDFPSRLNKEYPFKPSSRSGR
jgi:hypothetical protein